LYTFWKNREFSSRHGLIAFILRQTHNLITAVKKCLLWRHHTATQRVWFALHSFTLHSFASSSGLWKQFFWSQECFIEAALAFALSYLCTLQARIRLTVSQSFMSYLLTPSRGRKLLNELGVLIWPIAYMLRILFQSQTSKISHEESTCSNNTYANLVKLSSSTEQLDTKAHTFISANSDSFTIK